MQLFVVEDKKGNLLVEFEADSDTAAAIVFLIQRATEEQAQKLAAWMIGHGFDTGDGKTQEELLRELSEQIKENP